MVVAVCPQVTNVVLVCHHQAYYYNARTRESSWSKPDGVKIIQQSELNPLLVGGAGGTGASVGVTAAASSSCVNTTASTAAASPTQALSTTPSRTLSSSPDSISTPSPSVTIAGKCTVLYQAHTHTHTRLTKKNCFCFCLSQKPLL